MHTQLEQIMDKKIQKDPKPSSHLGAKAGYRTCNLHMSPPKRWTNHLSHSSSPTHGYTPTLSIFKELVHHHRPSPYPQVSKGVRKPVACSSSPLLQQGLQ